MEKSKDFGKRAMYLTMAELEKIRSLMLEHGESTVDIYVSHDNGIGEAKEIVIAGEKLDITDLSAW